MCLKPSFLLPLLRKSPWNAFFLSSITSLTVISRCQFVRNAFGGLPADLGSGVGKPLVSGPWRQLHHGDVLLARDGHVDGVGQEVALWLGVFVLVVPPVLHGGVEDQPGALLARRVHEGGLHAVEVLAEEGHPELEDVTAGHPGVLVHGGADAADVVNDMLRLVDPDGELGVAVAVEGPLVDVGAADDQVGVVHDHQLGVDVDHVPPGLSQLGGPGPHGRIGQVRRGDVAKLLLFAQAEEHEVLSGVGGVLEAGGVDGLSDAGVHHLHGAVLPEEHLLDGVVRRDALGVHRDHHVHGKP